MVGFRFLRRRQWGVEVTENLFKVFFHLEQNDWHGLLTESMWAEPLEEPPPRLVLRNSPFYFRGVSFLDTVDVVLVEADGEDRLEFIKVAARGGHSTYMVLVPMECGAFDARWPQLERLHCSYEKTDLHTSYGHRQLYSIDVPPETDIDAVHAFLAEGERDGTWNFQAGHIEHKPGVRATGEAK